VSTKTQGIELRQTYQQEGMALAAARQRTRAVIPDVEWSVYEPVIARINRLKSERQALILAHNYQTPEIFHGVADVTGDSLALAQRAADSDAEVVVMCGVHFMAETAKVLNPERMVLIPDLRAGCSLAESITACDVRRLRDAYPGVPIVTYVNTSAEVKAECDICCTSANAVEVVESLGSERVVFVPDEYLAHHVAANTDVEVIPWLGHCEVHEQFTPAQVAVYREQFPGVTVLAHPECSSGVLEAADMVGSTSGMIRFIRDRRPQRVVMITECSMSDNVAAEFPHVELVRTCTICPHMKRVTLEGIERALLELRYPVEVPPEIAERARRSVERMLEVGRGGCG